MRKEGRKHRRLTFNLKSKLIHDGALVFNGVTRNISFSGAFIELEGVPQVFKDDYFSLVLLARVELSCRVIHSNPDGIGFKFDFIWTKYYEHFKELMLTTKGYLEKLVYSFKFETHEKFYHRHIADIPRIKIFVQQRS